MRDIGVLVVGFFYPINTPMMCGCSGFCSCLGRGDSDGVGGNYVIGASLGIIRRPCLLAFRFASTNLPEKLPLKEVEFFGEDRDGARHKLNNFHQEI
jgi:hypothetical protein